MSNQQRRYVTAQRNSQKQTHRPSYQPLALSTHSQTNISPDIPRYGSSAHLLVVPTSSRMKYSDMPRSPSASQVKSREQLLKSNIVKRKNEGVVSNLKSELQNLKLQVSRIMNKDSDNMRASSSRGSGVHSNYQDYEVGSHLELKDYGKQISDSVSVTSEKVIDEPLRKLQLQFGTQNYDPAHYLELENNLLKTELRNLKNKYNATKQQLRQKCDALQKKNQYLQVSLRKSEDSLRECKRNLDIQIQTIKFQLNRKSQQQAEQQKLKSQMIYAERDIEGGNQFMQQKLKKLYEELNQKSRIINNMNLEFNDIRGQVEKKSFQLKKEIQRSRQFGIQLEFAKRQNSRNQNLLEQQVSKKIQLTKNVEALRQRVSELTKQLSLKDQIVNNSEEFENKLSVQIQNYKENEQKLSHENFELQNQLRKLSQLNRTNNQQIKLLKQTINDFTSQIEQLSKSLRLEKEKAMQTEQSYRTMIDQIKVNSQRQHNQLQRQFEKYRQLSTQTNFQKQEQLKQRADTDIKQKDRQISKWKAQYKLLKIKFEEHAALQNSKKQQIQSYYRNYKQYKTKNKVLEMRNKVLEDSANQSIEKIQNIQSANLEQRAHYLQTINNLNMHCQQLSRSCQSLQLQLNEVREALNSQAQRANQEEIYRKDIQQRVLTLNVEDNQGLMQVLEKVKKRVNDQDEKINKYVKESKNKDVLLNKLRQQIRNVMESQQKELQNFRTKQIGDVVHQIQSKTFVSFEQLKVQSKKQIQIQVNTNTDLINQNAKLKGQVTELTKQLMELRQQTKSISHLYNVKSSDLQQTRDKHKSEIDNYEQKLEQLQKIKNNQIQNLQSELASKNQQNQLQRGQIKMLNSISFNIGRQNFDQALKNQIQASKKLRDELNKKNEQVYRIRDSFAQLKAQYDNLKSQSDINKLKSISQKKNLQVTFDVETQQLKSHLLVEQKKVGSLEQKIKLVIDQNKKKDNFIQTYIMGKKLPTNQRQFMQAFLKEYQICVTGKNITQKLQTQSQQLQKLTLYNFNLMKQIAQMKEKMLLYQAISTDNSELGKSISQFDSSPNRRILLSAKSNPDQPKRFN